MKPAPYPALEEEDCKSTGVGEIYLENHRLREKLGGPFRSEPELDKLGLPFRPKPDLEKLCVPFRSEPDLLGTSAAELGGAVSYEHLRLLQQNARNNKHALVLKTKRWMILTVAVSALFVLCLIAVIVLAVTGRSNQDESSLKQSSNVNDCPGDSARPSFPDLDYSLLGYNALKGYPLAVGHDPGFTLPIFKADYSSESSTADCRYSVPEGVLLLPDVSCVISFSSEVVKTSYQFSRSLETSAEVNGGGWGVSFSASVGYNEAASRMSTGESVFILSKATCNYYQMKLLEDDAPPFHPLFLDWVMKLNQAQSQAADPQTETRRTKFPDTPKEEEVFLEFFEKYGTHFLTDAKFGASYTYEHQMKTSDFKKSLEKGVNVEAAASYSGAFNVGGEMKMNSSLEQSASEFREKVTTRTITVGAAPPADGEAMTWASAVQENPVPITYTLHSIENLFSETYMGRPSMAKYNIDYENIRRSIQQYKEKYCYSLKDKGLVDSCGSLTPGLIMPRTEIFGQPESVKVSSLDKCVDECNKRASCVAVDFCVHCIKTDFAYNTCQLYKEGDVTKAYKNDKFEAMVILNALDKQIVLRQTAVSGVERSLINASAVTTEQECFAECLEDLHCVAFTYTDHPDKQKCTLYSDKSLTLVEESDTTTHFISRRVKSVHDIYTTTTTTTPTTPGSTLK